MNISEALATAANIMLLGMVCVFVFLGILVFALKLLEKFAGSEAAPVGGSLAPAGVSPVNPATQVDSDVAAAITAAVHKFRQTKLND